MTNKTKEASATIKLAAYLVREACGLDDAEPVALTAGAEPVRLMVLAAKDEIASLRTQLAESQEHTQQLADELNVLGMNIGKGRDYGGRLLECMAQRDAYRRQLGDAALGITKGSSGVGEI